VGSGAHKTCHISETVQDRTILLLRANRKSHAPFRLVPNSMTLDNLERLERHSCRNETVLRSPPKKFEWR